MRLELGWIEFYFIFLEDFIYLFMRNPERERERERGRDTGRGRNRLHAGSLMWDSIPGPQEHPQRQMLNHWATQASLNWVLIPSSAQEVVQGRCNRAWLKVMSGETYFHAHMSPSSYYSIASYPSIWTDELIEISGSLWLHLLKVQL